jgi:hypothetical protein
MHRMESFTTPVNTEGNSPFEGHCESVDYTQIKFLIHREHIVLSLERLMGECCTVICKEQRLTVNHTEYINTLLAQISVLQCSTWGYIQ